LQGPIAFIISASFNIHFIMNNTMHNSYNLSVMVWNVRGAGSKDFLLTLKELINRHRPNILALMEMKINGQTADGVCQQIHHLGFNHKFIEEP